MKITALTLIYLFSVVSGFLVSSPKKKIEIPEIQQEEPKFSEETKNDLGKKNQPYFTEEDSLKYLSKYGYLPLVNANSHNVFSRTTAVLAFQKFANLPETGVIDEQTVAKMRQPRCGVLDIHSTLSNYKLGPSKWSKHDLTYRITKYTKDLPESVQRIEIAKAFKYWSDVTPLSFRELKTGTADIMIKFVVKDHGDGYDFDGKGNVLAHAFYPENGDAHYDDDEHWTSGSRSGINLLAVATHEFGHSLGLDHSNIDTAIMAPFYNGYQKDLKLDKDDIEAIQKWYGPKDGATTTAAPTTTTTTTPAPTTTTTTTTTPAPTTTTTTTTTTAAPTTPAPTTTIQPTTAPTTTTPAATTTITTTPTTATTTPTTTTTTPTTTTTIPTTTKPTTIDPSISSAPTTTTVPTTTTPLATTMTPTRPRPPKFPPHNFPCPFRFGAIMADESGNSIAFAGSYFVVIDKEGNVQPIRNRIRSMFPQGPSYVHAAAYDPGTNATFLFRDRSVWKYVEGKLIPGFPKYLGIFPLAAVVEDGQLMLLTTSYIYHLDKNTMHWLTYPVSIRTEYPGIPYYFRAAVSYGHGYIYFFRWRKIYELDIYTGEISQMDC